VALQLDNDVEPNRRPAARMIEVWEKSRLGIGLTRNARFDESDRDTLISSREQVKLEDFSIERRAPSRVLRAIERLVVVVPCPGLEIEIACQGDDTERVLHTFRKQHRQRPSAAMPD
jgi:hypothetical protein